METQTENQIDDQNGNKSKPLLQAVAITECLEILTKEMSLSMHFSKYPQDRFKNEPEPKEIKVLISTSQFHDKRWQDIKAVIDHLISVSGNCL
jgi:hypothetical protein